MSKQKLDNLWKPKQLDLFEEQEKTTGVFFGGIVPEPKDNKTAADILAEMAQTYRERNVVYGDNFKTVGPVMQQLHPNGVRLETPEDHELFHLYSLLIVKLTRFAHSELKHRDSIHDLSVYGAMLEAILEERENG